MNAVLTGFVSAWANYFPVSIGFVTYIHASEEEQARMKEIVKLSLKVGAVVGAGASAGWFLGQYGVYAPLDLAIQFVTSHTIAIGGEIGKLGVLYSVYEVVKNRGFMRVELEG